MSDVLSFQMADPNIGGMVIQQDRRHVEFRTGTRLMARKSEEAGRPIHEPIVLFCVRHPGERDETVVMAHDFHKEMHPRQWAAYEAGTRADPSGTPLDVLFPADPHVVKHMRGLHIFTAEMLAECGEEGLRRIGMGARDYVARAQKFVAAAEKAAPMHQVEAALRQRDDEIQSLKDQVQALIEAGKRRGRAAKQEDEGEAA